MWCLNAWYKGSVSRWNLRKKFHSMIVQWWPNDWIPLYPLLPKCCHFINLFFLLPVAAAGPLVSKPWLGHTGLLSCTSVMHQSSAVQPVYTYVSLPCIDHVIAPPPLSFCSPVGERLYCSSQTDSPSLSSLMNRRCSSWRITSHSSPCTIHVSLHLTLLLSLKKNFKKNSWPGLLYCTHCKQLCIRENAKCTKC